MSSHWSLKHQCNCLGGKIDRRLRINPIKKIRCIHGPLQGTNKQEPEKLGRNKEHVLSWKPVKETISEIENGLQCYIMVKIKQNEDWTILLGLEGMEVIWDLSKAVGWSLVTEWSELRSEEKVRKRRQGDLPSPPWTTPCFWLSSLTPLPPQYNFLLSAHNLSAKLLTPLLSLSPLAASVFPSPFQHGFYSSFFNFILNDSLHSCRSLFLKHSVFTPKSFAHLSLLNTCGAKYLMLLRIKSTVCSLLPAPRSWKTEWRSASL